MGKTRNGNRLAAKASTAEKRASISSAQVLKPSSIPMQRTKVEKRKSRHDAFLKKIQDKKKTKRRKHPKKLKVNLSSLGSTLDEIMAEDQKAKSRKMEVGVRPKGKELQNEIERFKAVMEHPQFKANPLKAIRQHVENTWEKKEGMA